MLMVLSAIIILVFDFHVCCWLADREAEKYIFSEYIFSLSQPLFLPISISGMFILEYSDIHDIFRSSDIIIIQY